MPSQMTDEELENARASAKVIDEYEYRNDDDDDDYYMISLYKTNDNRHFQWLESSGFNSRYMGSMDNGIWLSDDEVENWRDYY